MNAAEQPPSKKRRVPNGRVRVTRACDWCKKKKLRCTGTQPCSLCMQANQDCTYTAEYNRGRVPAIAVIPQSDGDLDGVAHHLQHEDEAGSMGTLSQSEPSHFSMMPAVRIQGQTESEDHPPVHTPTSAPGLAPATTRETLSIPKPQFGENHDAGRSSRNSPEPAQTDQDGHYVGPSSGISFLSRALKKLHQHVSSASNAQGSSIFNFGDAPLPQYDPYFLILPSRKEAKALVRRYFDFAFPTHRFLHQPTVEAWCEDFYDSIKSPKPLESGVREIRAVLLMVFAQAKQYSYRQDPISDDMVHSAAYFAASEHHLLHETGGIRLTSIQARLAQCFYLLSQSRVNHAWSLFGTVANLALAIGLHRSKRRDIASRMDVVEHECRKRVFWSAFSLDNYLSAALGRPRSFHEEDLDQDLPSCLDDSQVTPTKIIASSKTGQSVMLASVCHAKLSRIISGTLRDLYGIKRLAVEKQVEIMQLYDGRLRQWRHDIRSFLDLPNVDVLMTVYLRQHTVLQFAYSHAVILLHRPALLRRTSTTAANHNNVLQSNLSLSVQKCLEAATTIVSKLRELTEKGQMYAGFWFTHYYVFSALVALYLYVVHNCSNEAHIWKPYLDLAQQGLRDLSACATETSYAQRYVVVLTELQNEALRSVEREARPLATPNGGHPLHRQANAALQQTISREQPISPNTSSDRQGNEAISTGQLPPRLTDSEIEAQLNGNFDSQYDIFNPTGDLWALSNLTNWEDFDALAMEGLADLEFLFSTEDTNPFQQRGPSF